jgi:hypothetical protein
MGLHGNRSVLDVGDDVVEMLLGKRAAEGVVEESGKEVVNGAVAVRSEHHIAVRECAVVILLWLAKVQERVERGREAELCSGQNVPGRPVRVVGVTQHELLQALERVERGSGFGTNRVRILPKPKEISTQMKAGRTVLPKQ